MPKHAQNNSTYSHTFNTIDSVVLNPNKDEIISVSTRQIPKVKKPPYMAISGGEYVGDRDKNLLQQIGKMNAPERWFFLLVESKIDYANNVAKIINANLTNSEVAAKTKGYKSLHAKGLLKRVKREHYMINPAMIIYLKDRPDGSSPYLDAKQLWESLP